MEKSILINGVVNISDKENHDEFLDKFIEFLEENGWIFGGLTEEIKESSANNKMSVETAAEILASEDYGSDDVEYRQAIDMGINALRGSLKPLRKSAKWIMHSEEPEWDDNAQCYAYFHCSECSESIKLYANYKSLTKKYRFFNVPYCCECGAEMHIEETEQIEEWKDSQL